MKSVVLPGYPRYEIYEDGRVFDLKSNRWLKQTLHLGYLKATLRNVAGERKINVIHRLLALAFTPNPFDKPCVDHIDRDPLNNSLSNLRWATYNENNQNRSNTKRQCSSQYMGVCFDKRANSWKSSIGIQGKKLGLGYFATELEAHHAYQEAKSRLHIKS